MGSRGDREVSPLRSAVLLIEWLLLCFFPRIFLLSFPPVSLVASWADSVARDEFPWSPPLHFINTPDWDCTYDRTRDCNDNGVQNVCVDGAIQNFTSQLVAGNAPLTLNVALKFVIHFIGDIHQPLHVGFAGDEVSGTATDSERGERVNESGLLDSRSDLDCFFLFFLVLVCRAATPSTAPSRAPRIVVCTRCGTRT